MRKYSCFLVLLTLMVFEKEIIAQQVPDSEFAQIIYNACPNCIDLGTQNLLPAALNTASLDLIFPQNPTNQVCYYDFHGLEFFPMLNNLKIKINFDEIAQCNYDSIGQWMVPTFYFSDSLKNLEIESTGFYQGATVYVDLTLPNALKILKLINMDVNISNFPTTLEKIMMDKVHYSFGPYPTSLKEMQITAAIDINAFGVPIPNSVERLMIYDINAWHDFTSTMIQVPLIMNNSNVRFLEYQGSDSYTSSYQIPFSNLTMLDSLFIITADSIFLNAVPPNLKYLSHSNVSGYGNYNFLNNLPQSLKTLLLPVTSDLNYIPALPSDLEIFKVITDSYPDSLILQSPLPNSLKHLVAFDTKPLCFPTLPQGLLTLSSNFIFNVSPGNSHHTCIPNYPPQMLVYHGSEAIFGGINIVPPICSSSGQTCLSYQSPRVNGNVFLDLNNDGIWNGGNDPTINLPVQREIIPSGIISYIYPNPLYINYFYDFIDTNTSYIYSVANPFLNYTIPTPVSINTNNAANQVFDVNLIFTPAFSFDDIEIEYAQISLPQPGYYSTGYFSIKNKGTNTVNGTISATLNNIYGMAYSQGASFSNNVITWNYNLNPGESNWHSFYAMVNQTAQIGDTGTINFEAGLNGTDYDTSNNYITKSQPVVSSFDPNDIQVDKSIISTSQVQQGIDLIYTIRFQNTGNAAAINIYLTDSLSDFLNPSYLEVLYSSHPNFQVQIINTNNIDKPYLLKVIYNNIFLPDSGTNNIESNGLFAFKIRVRNNAVMGSIIPAEAQIYFDFNPAVITNTTSTIVMDPTISFNQNKNKLSMNLAPNPVYQIINCQITSSINEILVAEIVDFTGKIILSKKINVFSGTDTYQLNLDNISSGIYFFKLTNNQGQLVSANKFVKL